MASAILIFAGILRSAWRLLHDRRGTTPLEYAVIAVFSLMIGVTLLISADFNFQKPIDQMTNVIHKITTDGGIRCAPRHPAAKPALKASSG